jgi:hypothetical protein
MFLFWGTFSTIISGQYLIFGWMIIIGILFIKLAKYQFNKFKKEDNK